MAKIKSSLEIALARAQALGGVDREEEAAQEGERQGAILARRLLTGELTPPDLAAGIANLPAAGQNPARLAGAKVLLQGLSEKPEPSLSGLQEMAQVTDAAPAAARLNQAVQAMDKAVAALRETLAVELSQLLAKSGISGEAVRVNPRAHPAYKKRLQKTLAASAPDLEEAQAAYLKSLGAP